MARSCAVLLYFVALLGSCVDNPTAVPEEPPLLSGSRATFTIVVPKDASPGLRAAARDLSDAAAEIGGGESPRIVFRASRARTPFVVAAEIVGDSDLGAQDYRLDVGEVGNARGISVEAASHVGAMYGFYHVIADMGVRYHHPEQTFFPDDPEATLPWSYDEVVESPHFALRGFHEHTQHPIPMSEIYLQADPALRPYVSRYLRWMARNRQNVASWHMLKTVDLEEWEPYIADVADEAHGYGIDIGMVVSFVDEQQNNFKVIDDPDRPADEQIGESMRRFGELGFDFLTFQSGSSEFTKPADEDVVAWLDHAAEVSRELDIDLWSWIHISCDLHADDGSIFWHLPGRSDPDVGAWVHTVMFHDLQHPAPVYGCQDFRHQVDFIEAEEGERELVYYPESAWWLGFDNNTPIALPITGWTRAYDIQEVLADREIRGHVTFTSGREWTYWQYDHFLTRATWEGDFGWRDYQEWLAGMYGEHGEAVVDVTDRWTELQRRNFFEENPLVYFYVAGELKQDEVGAQAGIIARRPKRSYQEVVGYADDEFAEWRETEFDLLGEMVVDHLALRDELEVPSVPDGSDLRDVLYFEFYTALDVYVKRIQHAVALYQGVIEVREWVRAREAGAEVDGAVYQEQLAAAQTQLEEARAITEQATTEIHLLEEFYRYPDEFLNEAQPDSLTSYPYGYLEQTHTAHFWVRRDDQLERLIDDAFFERPDEWESEPDVLFYAEDDAIELIEPDNSVAQTAISQFIPRMLFGLSGTLESGSDDVTLTMGQDFNENFIADRGTEETLDVVTDDDVWTARGEVYTFIARNDTGEELGDGLSVFDPEFTLDVTPGREFSLDAGELAGNVAKQNLINLVVSVAGIDEEGVENLLKGIFGVPADEELPALLPFRFAFEFTPAP